MTTHTIMDKTGDTKHEFDSKNATAVAGAKQRFDGLLCPSCMCEKAHEAGIEGVIAVFRSGPFASEKHG